MPERCQACIIKLAETSEPAQAEVQALQAWKLTRTQNGAQAGQPEQQHHGPKAYRPGART